MRERIISEIQRLANENNGQPPGRQLFEKQTGIRLSDWLGKIWSKWSDAVKEAGLEPQSFNKKWDTDLIFPKLAMAFRYYGCVPTKPQLQLFRANNPDFPWHSSLENHFGSKAKMLEAFRDWAKDKAQYADILALLPAEPSYENGDSLAKDGFVYLIKSGAYYKIGRGDELEKRVKQIRTALPDASTLEHAIRTDDPPGIELYWHRRFADKRANGEWFKLSAADVSAFKKRRFQ